MLRLARRVAGYLFAFIAACSALVCVASAVLWVRGYFVGDKFQYTQRDYSDSGERSDTDYVVASSRGRVALAVTGMSGVTRQDTRSLTWGRDRPPIPITWPSATPWGRFGFQVINEAALIPGGAFIMAVGVVVPSWFAVLIGAAPPAVWCLLRRRRRRAQLRLERGQCVRCGYDLREGPERCPECGEVSTLAPIRS